MKTITIGTSNMKHGSLKNLETWLLFDLKNEFNFVYSDNPDFLIVSDYNSGLDYLRKDCVLIFYSTENIHPNFEFFDYCIGYSNQLSFGDRYCFYLPAIRGIQRFLSKDLKFRQLSRVEGNEILSNKNLFCDFTYNHDNKRLMRKHYLELLGKYKEVSIGGRLYNNKQSNDKRVYNYSSKIELQKKCKFSIVVESCEFSGGLVTEKIFHAILSNTIPIYYGDEDVYKYVNPKRFIDAKNYTDSELLNLIIKIDNDDNLFLDYICEKALVDENFFAKNQKRLSAFLRNIFNQDPAEALRKPANEFSTRWLKDRLIESDNLYNAGMIKTFNHLLSLFFHNVKKLIRFFFKKKEKSSFCDR